jgi:triacylglycerol lipase
MSVEATRLFWLVLCVGVAVLVVVRMRRVRRVFEKMRADLRLGSGAAVDRVTEVPLRRIVLPELARVRGAPLVLLTKPPPTRHPIVLAHGYLGFASVGLYGARREYFVGVRERLQALGYTVHLARLSPTGSVVVRAAQLARQIESLRAERVNIIAHSMGGLDARYAIAHLGLHSRVASLTTIGTPHWGTPIADSSTLFIGDWPRARRMLHRLGANIDGLYDLTTLRMQEFNRLVPDAAGVIYSSIVGAVAPLGRPVNPFLVPSHTFLQRIVGPNDGIVPAESQKWGDLVGEIDADHWEQVGWSRIFDAQRFYAIVAEHLAEWGL